MGEGRHTLFDATLAPWYYTFNTPATPLFPRFLEIMRNNGGFFIVQRPGGYPVTVRYTKSVQQLDLLDDRGLLIPDHQATQKFEPQANSRFVIPEVVIGNPVL